jgi:nucleotide-binding universal stress UspA family protein
LLVILIKGKKRNFLEYFVIRALLITMKKMLVAYDGSDASKKAVETVVKCSNKNDEITLLTVIPAELAESSFTKMLLPTIDLSSIVKSGSFKEKAMESLQKISKQLEHEVLKVNTIVESGDPADEILITAKKVGADIIVVGYKGYGKEGRFLLGSVTDKVVRHASTSVLVVR